MRIAFQVITIGIILFSLLLSIGCSDDDNPIDSDQPTLVGVWDLITIKADGVMVDPANDDLNLYINDGIYTYNKNGTGTVVFDYGDTFDYTWAINADTIIVNNTIKMLYLIQGDTLTTFQSGDNDMPDLETMFLRI